MDWKSWGVYDLEHCTRCEDCGLPLILNEDGTKQCVYCTWVSDERDVMRGQLISLVRIVDNLSNEVRKLADKYI
jgi:hypothetical protein